MRASAPITKKYSNYDSIRRSSHANHRHAGTEIRSLLFCRSLCHSTRLQQHESHLRLLRPLCRKSRLRSPSGRAEQRHHRLPGHARLRKRRAGHHPGPSRHGHGKNGGLPAGHDARRARPRAGRRLSLRPRHDARRRRRHCHRDGPRRDGRQNAPPSAHRGGLHGRRGGRHGGRGGSRRLAAHGAAASEHRL